MNLQELERFTNGDSRVASPALSQLMRKVYTWMTLALVVTGITAYGVASSPNLMISLVSSNVMWFLMIAELGLVWYTTARIDKLSLTTASTIFVIYSALNGVVFSTIFLAFTMASIIQVFFITAATFGAMSLFGYTTKMDLSRIGSILFMALIGLVIATIVNIFMKSSALEMIISYAGVIIFVGLTAWDTQKIKAMLEMHGDTGEAAQKTALIGALTLYLDFINLFIFLLRILGKRN